MTSTWGTSRRYQRRLRACSRQCTNKCPRLQMRRPQNSANKCRPRSTLPDAQGASRGPHPEARRARVGNERNYYDTCTLSTSNSTIVAIFESIWCSFKRVVSLLTLQMLVDTVRRCTTDGKQCKIHTATSSLVIVVLLLVVVDTVRQGTADGKQSLKSWRG